MVSTAVLPSAVARVLGIKTEFKNVRNGNVVFLPQRIAVIGQGASAATYSTVKKQHTNARTVGDDYGHGSPLHLAAMQLFPLNGDGVASIPVTFYPLNDNGAGVAATGSITPAGTQTVTAEYQIVIAGIKSAIFTVLPAATIADRCDAIVAAINAIPEMPVIAVDGATVVNLTSKWEGVSANDIIMDVDGSVTAGGTFTLSQLSGGAANPTIDAALAQIGDVWETIILNCLNIEDSAALDAISTFGEGRWGALTHKPLQVFTGNTTADRATAVAICNARAADRINGQLVAPGSNNLPCVVAARQVVRIAVLADSNPPHDYGSQVVSGINPGTDAQQWLYADRDAAVKAGSSTVVVRDGVIHMADTVTFYHPANDPLPAYRFSCDIVKLQNVIFNLRLQFASAEWDGAPLVADDEPSVNPTTKKPKTAKAAICAIIDSLCDWAILTDREWSKGNVICQINSQNPKRLDCVVPVKLGGNSNIVSVDLNFSFFLGA